MVTFSELTLILNMETDMLNNMKVYLLTMVALVFSCPVTAVTLQWDLPVDIASIEGYEVHYGDSSMQYTEIVDVPGTATNIAIAPDPAVGQTLYYAVRSRNADASLVSTFSNEVSLTIPADVTLAPPGNLIIIPSPVDTPVAEYLFDGNVFDTSGNGLDGMMIGGTFVEGQTGQALQFNGTSDRVDLAAVDIPGEAMTLAAWVYVNNYVTDGRIISKATGVSSDDHWWMMSTTTDGSFRFRLKTSGVTTTLISPAGLVPLSTWVHLMAVYDGINMTLYADGTEVAQAAKTGLINEDPSVTVSIGAQPQGVYTLDGILDEVLIYNQAISAW